MIEIVVVVAIVGILAGILTPMVRGYIGTAKVRKAEQDTRALGEAVLSFNKDTARFPIYASGTATTPTSAIFPVLRTADGGMPSSGLFPIPIGFSGWGGRSDTFENQLKTNTPGGSGAPYPTVGKFAWRGPYIGPVRMDPWGDRYLCNAETLKPDVDKASWVLSAGPNEKIETSPVQGRGSPVVGGDDIAYRIK
jgi:type II secretory pathway pseudopilin PulG